LHLAFQKHEKAKDMYYTSVVQLLLARCSSLSCSQPSLATNPAMQLLLHGAQL
jgi:hypothetical protein